MHSHALAQLERNPEWRLLLTAYQVRQMGSPDGWVDRIFELANLDSDQLSKFHGRLIALGMLEFELAGRGDGMRYQLSPLGKQAQRGGTVLEYETQLEAEAA
ncbi:MAG: hypothetical protein V4719_13160 [Planctomycetota bacterium]